VHWRPEGALAGVVEQQPQSAVQKLGRTRPMLVAERAALLTQLVVRRMRLADSGKEIHGALVCQEIQESHKLPMQAAGCRRDQGQESLSVLQVCEFYSEVTQDMV